MRDRTLADAPPEWHEVFERARRYRAAVKPAHPYFQRPLGSLGEEESPPSRPRSPLLLWSEFSAVRPGDGAPA